MSDVKYKMIDVNNYKDLTKETLLQIHQILKAEAYWNDSFSEFKKKYTKRNFKNIKLFLVFSDNHLAGFIEGFSIGKDQFYAKSFYVSKNYRNLKIGTKLKLRTFSVLKKLGYKKYTDGFVVNPLVTKINQNLVNKRKKESLKKNPKLTFPYGIKDKEVFFKTFKKRR